MKLEELLSEKKPAVIRKWVDMILETYPADTSKFLKEHDNRFTNPVGHTISQGLENIFDELLRGIDYDRVSPFLDNIIRIRAVQDFTPSQAISFVLSLKKIIREELGGDIPENLLCRELPTLESAIDTLALFSFDIFVKCREKLYDIKANELRNMTFRLLQRVNTLGEDPGDKAGDTDSATDNVKGKEVTK